MITIGGSTSGAFRAAERSLHIEGIDEEEVHPPPLSLWPLAKGYPITRSGQKDVFLMKPDELASLVSI